MPSNGTNRKYRLVLTPYLWGVGHCVKSFFWADLNLCLLG